ncbi:putative cyclin-dependent kinase F-2 [Lolium rigidum]|uniref:putative cyclin-dependent kinase F-2 n=1 Tax=Lolium rigidum TaxID=89674 RepID=UPI001F5DCB6B|nr:putative cyclin-dependent kinase F-2 [Lolium rigidum]
MAICKRPAAAVAMGGQAVNKKRKVVVAKRTWPGPSGIKKAAVIKKPAAYATTADYEEEKTCLGEGAFGVVFKARHRVTGQTVAIKHLASPPPEVDAAECPDPREQLLREARFLEACSGNPHVVGFHGVVLNPSTTKLGLVMDFVAGQSLRDILDERQDRSAPPPPEATVRAFMRQLLTGAKGVHERNVVHRDIKPANLLLTEGEEVLKICDFGLAISASDPPPHSEAGTMPYAAPEVLLGKPDIDSLVDAWSIGCVMAELVGGEMLLLRAGVEEALLEMQRLYAEEIIYLWTIFGLLGTPDEVEWPGFASLPRAAKIPALKPGQRSRLRELFPEETLSEEGFEVMEGLLTCNPDKRLTAADALKLPWFAGDED